MHKMFKGRIFGLYATLHGRLGVWVFDLCYLSCLFVNVNSAFACSFCYFACKRLDNLVRDEQSMLLGNVYQPFGFRFASSSLAII